MKARAILLLVCLTALCPRHGATQEPDTTRVVHVFVALCDNEHQGIEPVPEELGDGEDPEHNLYWGASYGVKTFFSRSAMWTLVETVEKPSEAVVERLVFRHPLGVYLVADAYKGSEIKQAIVDYLDAASGKGAEKVTVRVGEHDVSFEAGGAAELVAYVGHNGLMDFDLDSGDAQPPGNESNEAAESAEAGDNAASGDADAVRDAVVLCCKSRSYFAERLEKAGARPLLMTTGLMAPEAYTLKAALDGWIANESAEQIRLRAAKAYDEHQDCNLDAAKRLFGVGDRPD